MSRIDTVTDERPKVEVNAKWCKRCGICTAFCPKKALAEDDKGRVILIDPEACNLCGLCEARCPDLAIRVRRERQ